MNIAYDQRLKDYMHRKGYAAIVVDAVSATGCCADMTELYTRFATEDEAARLKERGCRVLDGEVGELLLVARGLELDDEIRLGLRSFLGAKDVTVRGIRAWHL